VTVAKLIQEFQRHPRDMRVVVDGYDDLSPDQLQKVKITLNSGTHDYLGTHGAVDFLSKAKLAGLEVEQSLVLCCTSN